MENIRAGNLQEALGKTNTCVSAVRAVENIRIACGVYVGRFQRWKTSGLVNPRKIEHMR